MVCVLMHLQAGGFDRLCVARRGDSAMKPTTGVRYLVKA